MSAIISRIFHGLFGVTFLLVVALALFLTVYALLIVWNRYKYRHIPGPPVKNFLFGNGGELNFNRINNYKVYIKWAKEYGAIFKLLFFHKVIIFITSPDLVRELLTKNKYKKCSELYNPLRNLLGVPFLGNGLVTTLDNADWRVKRQAINPAFHRSFLEKFTYVFNKTADKLMIDLGRVADSGKVVKMIDYFHEATLDVIGEVAFSYSTKTDYDPNRNFSHDLYLVMKLFTEMSFDITMKFNPWKRAYLQKCKEAIQSIRRTVMGILEKRISDTKSGKEVPRDILTIMLENLSQTCTKEDIADEMVTFFVAGQETTANMLGFLLLEVGRHPEYLDEMRNEVARVVGDKEYIDHEDLNKLNWITATIKETLRLYPPSGGTSREMPEDGTLNGYKLPKKTNMIISFFAVHYLHHENGFDFKPEWWLEENNPQTDFNFMPFSLGQRSCIGRQFAYTEAKILLCKFLQNFNFELDPTQSFGVEEAATQRPVDGVRVTLSRLN